MRTWCLCFLILAITFVVESSKIQDLNEGVRINGDKQAIKEKIKFSRKLLQERREVKTFTVKGFITFIRLLNNNREHGATPRITGGGVGNNYVNIEFRSRKSHGIDFDIEIYETDKWESKQ
ncbi:PREDICTED: probable salivary secreted peptide [Ceratosolen solmsi marchali]|uniref:Probable salivary secreted peptide n=1 Tax=Ceratosolen solmsi marchali TaxID=326594 RepID=A0AAJ6YXU0_9HYME|nr:PREDICTED: probable salivary secreted peptide [Ceratosolen solmsi marchali]